MTFLAEKFDKFSFYLNCGFSLDVPYEDVVHAVPAPKAEDDDLQAQVTFYNINSMFKGCTLRFVVEQVHPELLND